MELPATGLLWFRNFFPAAFLKESGEYIKKQIYRDCRYSPLGTEELASGGAPLLSEKKRWEESAQGGVSIPPLGNPPHQPTQGTRGSGTALNVPKGGGIHFQRPQIK
jgi:hypothetical protein